MILNWSREPVPFFWERYPCATMTMGITGFTYLPGVSRRLKRMNRPTVFFAMNIRQQNKAEKSLILNRAA